ncbi:MAG: response regulator [Methylohalobius sp. ZOD2]|nr:response regulator transcription factor [Methylothermaceae bacterium]
MRPIRLLLVDDHPVVRQGYRCYLKSAPDTEVVAEASDGSEAYQAFIACRPDITVLDISLPDVSGLAVLRRIRQRLADAKVLVFTIHDNPLLIRKALEAGARGYLSKRCGPPMLMEAVRRVMQGERYVESRLEQAVSSPPHELLQRLTAREFEVFHLLAQGRSVNEIASLLQLSSKTVGVHQTRILKKLDLPNIAHLVLLAVRCGLVEPKI